MIIKVLIILSGVAFAQSKTDNRVNDHMQKTNKKIEIEGQKKEVELKKDAPRNFKAQPKPYKKDPFIVYPTNETPDPGVFPDQYEHSVGKDPSTEFEQGVQDIRDTASPDEENAAYIRQFKENAAKAGVKVQIDPKTLKARPVKDRGTH